MAEGVHGRRARDLLQLLPRDGPPEGGLLESQGVANQAVDRSHDHVDRAHCPREGEALVQSLVGEVEADIEQKKISVTSPIARALIGKKKGDYIEVSTPKGVTSYEIKSVRFK